MKTRIKVLGEGRFVPQIKTLFGWRPIFRDFKGVTDVFPNALEYGCVVGYEDTAKRIIDAHVKAKNATYIQCS